MVYYSSIEINDRVKCYGPISGIVMGKGSGAYSVKLDFPLITEKGEFKYVFPLLGDPIMQKQ